MNCTESSVRGTLRELGSDEARVVELPLGSVTECPKPTRTIISVGTMHCAELRQNYSVSPVRTSTHVYLGDRQSHQGCIKVQIPCHDRDNLCCAEDGA
jgi:hypothetical protein